MKSKETRRTRVSAVDQGNQADWLVDFKKYPKIESGPTTGKIAALEIERDVDTPLYGKKDKYFIIVKLDDPGNPEVECEVNATAGRGSHLRTVLERLGFELQNPGEPPLNVRRMIGIEVEVYVSLRPGDVRDVSFPRIDWKHIWKKGRGPQSRIIVQPVVESGVKAMRKTVPVKRRAR
jgi:hypothetical protein